MVAQLQLFRDQKTVKCTTEFLNILTDELKLFSELRFWTRSYNRKVINLATLEIILIAQNILYSNDKHSKFLRRVYMIIEISLLGF